MALAGAIALEPGGSGFRVTIRAILFDFNGVIIDDERIQLRAYQQALAEIDVLLSEGEYWDDRGADDRAFVKAVLARAGREGVDPGSLIRRKAELHRGMIQTELPLVRGRIPCKGGLAASRPR